MKNVSTSDIVLVVQKYSDYINCICRKYFIIGGTKEDLYEEGVIGLLEACKDYNGESVFDQRFDAFAKLCIRRQIFDAIKKSNTNKNKVLNESISFNMPDGTESQFMIDQLAGRTSSNDPLELFLEREKVDERIKICEGQLSDFEKQVLNHYLLGEKQSEIAKILGRDVKAIDNTIQRIKAKLK